MNTIQLTDADLMPEDEAERLAGSRLLRQHYDRTVCDTMAVLKPDGSVLLTYVKDVLPRNVCESVYSTFERLPIPKTDSRGLAAGGEAFRRQLPDGTLSNTVRWRAIRSVVVGYKDREPRNPIAE
jgi:hypothetical protein